MSFRGRGNRRGGYNGMQYNNGSNNNGGALTGQELTNAAQQQQMANAVGVEVRGWQGASVDECVAFLSRKARIALQNTSQVNDAIVGYVRSQSDADALVKWSGVRFAGNPLRIQARSSATSGTIDLLKRFLHRRYNPEIKLLNLASIASDPELQLTNASVSTQSKMFPALMKLADQEHFDVASVDLSGNNLEDLTPVTALSQTYPKLLNLSLSNNRINKLRSLEIWKNKFRSLRELHFSNNPITVDPQYKNEVSKIFPRLVVLDGIPIRDEQKLKSIYELALPSKQFFFENDNIQQVSTQFITNFLQCWDGDRTQLLPLYTPESQFSMSMDSSVPNDANSNDIAFGYYIPNSRNLTRVSSERSRQERLGKGPEQIGKIFKQLPKTKHKLDTDPNAYSMEAWAYSQVNGIIISFHGEWQETAAPEVDPNGPQRGHRRGAIAGSSSAKPSPKSFDRVFVIIPANGSIIIASDILIVRPITSTKPWNQPTPAQPGSAGAGAGAAVPTTAPPSAGVASTNGVPLPDNLTPAQKDIATRLMMETKLNVQFTLLLAEQSGWNYDAAVQGFRQSHQQGQIPPEAFQ